MTPGLVLHLRARRAPAAVAISAGAIALVAGGWRWLAGDLAIYPGLAVLTAALAMAPLVPTLGGTDAALERTVALPWPPRRVAHLVTAAAIVAGLLLATRLAGAEFGPAGQIVRNAAGLVGLAGLTAALFGAGYAWQAPILWAGVQAFGTPDAPEAWKRAAFWLIQPAGDRAAAVTGAVLLLAGLIGYGLRAGPPVAAAQTPIDR
ncbi:hypothetical protein [Catenuloplanes indicus]|uniref:Uncharacterized protein n=1 Tax=Catenuloplanes indicus TaxID=137267 RepID=A0AAE4AVM7_9ACTN|nr:hypothetical protein [Catenuloplanes indicus]MDQ0364129.1 hypothetical protein [Catenuloplanes indicus]